MTSIDMAGYSITLLKLNAELKELVNAPADTPAFDYRFNRFDINKP